MTPLGMIEVVRGPNFSVPEHGVADARAEVDEEALVALAVLVVVLHLLGGVADGHFAVAVAEEDDAPGDEVALGGHALAAVLV
jgi:hypothetical protein